MRALHISLLTVALATVSLFCGQADAQQTSPQDVTDRFSKLDSEGRQLSATGADEVADQCLWKKKPWRQPIEINVTKDYSARVLSVGENTAEVAVGYRLLGRIESSLNFRRLEMPYSDHPIPQSEVFSLVFTDTHFELGSDGKSHPMKGKPEWRIKSYPAAPHISIDAALNYVRSVSYHSSNPADKTHAQRTIAELQQLQMPGSGQVAGGFQQPPQQVLSQFLEMMQDGQGLSPDGAVLLQMFLVHSPEWQHRRIRVTRAYAIRNFSISQNKTEADIEYGVVGELDSKLRFVPPGPNVNAAREHYTLVLDNKYALPAHGSFPAQQFAGPSRWRIEEGPSEQWISLEAAIRYLTQVRDTSGDPAIRANAENALTTLVNIRSHAPF